MRISFLSVLIALFLIQSISASCSESQVNINTASLADLDKLSGIGPAKAQEIVNSRPFISVGDLIRVKGIGEVTLSNIKTQGLACVDEEESEDEETDVEEVEKANEEVKIQEEHIENVESKQAELQTINLEPKAINTETSKGSLKKNFAVFGLGVFCVLLAVLFIIRRKKYKNEFK